ncbi:MAG: glycerol-3-phosphate dehydrogenase/oxidase, partial [Chloroflexi bacterium]|nr:glycerol-3-phosphate dehydrogenase/oxidase [Chloroflexota bacterium]
GDFASGTSSKTSRMVHGGLRYVAQGQFGVVAESCVERDRLWRLAPRLVWPTPFTVPAYQRSQRDLLLGRVAMWLYDALSRFRTYRRHRILSPEQVTAAEPAISQDRLVGGVVYYDCRANDARLTLAVVQSAHEHGAVVANHAEVLALLKEDGRVAGAEVVDCTTGERFTVRACVTVNATGVWSDRVRQMDDPGASPMMAPSRGTHIVVPHARLGIRDVVAFTGAGRTRFALKWEDTCIIGTTDPEHAGDLDRVAPSAAEVDELLAATNEVFHANLTRDEVISTYAGVRPLVLEEGKSAYQVSRAHKLTESAAGLLTIAGGKLTTYRRMAQDTVDRVVRKLQDEFGVRAKRGCQTAHAPLTSVPFDWDAATNDLAARYPGFDQDVLAHLARAYGPGADVVLESAREDPALGERLVPGLPYIWAEAPYTVQHEMALTLDDVLIRRMQVFYEDRDQGLGAVERVAALMARYLGWDPAEVERQLADYRQQVALSRAYREGKS